MHANYRYRKNTFQTEPVAEMLPPRRHGLSILTIDVNSPPNTTPTDLFSPSERSPPVGLGYVVVPIGDRLSWARIEGSRIGIAGQGSLPSEEDSRYPFM